MTTAATNLDYETIGPLRRALKAAVIHPLANYVPAPISKAVLRFSRSELAASNWADPGGWRSMVISYQGNPRQIADRILVGAGTIPMALRNRRRLGAFLLAGLIDECAQQPVHVLCLGAGPGHIIMDAMKAARRPSHATLVDLSSDAFDYGKKLAAEMGLADRVRFIQGDVRDVRGMLGEPPHAVKMIGICEYLSDQQIVDIVRAAAEVMPVGSAIVFNSISMAHGTDRFFRRVFGLNMVYRTAEQLQALMEQAGFGQFVSTPEPLGVYHVVVGRRIAGVNSSNSCSAKGS